VIGGVFAAVELTSPPRPTSPAALSQLAGAVSPLAELFITGFATRRHPAARRAAIHGGLMRDGCHLRARHRLHAQPDFTALLDAVALDFQTQLDPGDGRLRAPDAARARRHRSEARAGAGRHR
jgi:hypothetical protein